MSEISLAGLFFWSAFLIVQRKKHPHRNKDWHLKRMIQNRELDVGCPILAVGIGKECVKEYARLNKYYTKLEEIYERKEI